MLYLFKLSCRNCFLEYVPRLYFDNDLFHMSLLPSLQIIILYEGRMFICTTWYTVLRVLSPVVHASCFVEPKHYALFLRCRKFRNISSAGAQRCSHWQRRRLRRALHLQLGSTTSVQNAASILERQVPFSFAQSLLCIMLGTFFSISIASMYIIHQNVEHCIR